MKPSTDEQGLRGRAVALLRERQPESPDGDGHALRYELEVHQVELQMQNESLREACAELEASRERYRALFDHAPVAYFDLDAGARIERCNHAAAALLGEPVERLIGRRLSAFVVSEHGEPFEHHRREVLTSAERRTCTLALTDARGRRREVRVESARHGQDDALHWRCALVDMTELHRLQRSLQQAQRLEAMSSLASGVAHEFNNLLMGILGCADTALVQLPQESAARAPVELLQQAVVRGRSVVDQLLSFAHRGGGFNQPVDLDAIVRGSEPLLRQLLGDRVALQLELGAGGSMISADPGQCQQILLNLASNAAHAMSGGGTFRIETRCAAGDTLDADAHAQIGFRPCVVMTVTDTGMGMSAEAQARAFEPFFTTKRAGDGTGLGLSLVYGAVRNAGGHIALDSRPGEGTVVRIHWPQAGDAASPLAPLGRLSPMRAGSMHALLVDDDGLVRVALRDYLERHGFRVTEAASGEEALARMREAGDGGVQLLVSDVALPSMTGVQLAAAARTVAPELAVLFVSAHSPELLARRGWFDPKLPLLHKPFTAEELESAIADALAVQTWEQDW
jgi:PAS domain S-box-containing protein